jgi:heat shock protein HtpX
MAFILAAVMNLGSYWFSDKIVLRMYRAQEVSAQQAPDLYAMVASLARNAGLPMPRVYIIPQETPNAFATGRNPEHAVVAVTQGLLKLLGRDELMGVLAHEMAHVKNRDILIGSIAATIAGAISYLAHMAQWAAIFGGGRDDDEGSNPIAMIALAIIAPMAAMLVQMAISRSREYLADEGGAKLCGNPFYLASALRKLEMANQTRPMHHVNEATAHMFIVSPLRAGGIASLFSTHPPMAERIKRLESMTSLP